MGLLPTAGFVQAIELFDRPRTDGISFSGGTLQGARTYDRGSHQWTAPDAYAGDVHDPMSQKAYMWNKNNPVAYSDPSGYDPAPADPPMYALFHRDDVWVTRMLETLLWMIPGGEAGQMAKASVALGKVDNPAVAAAIMNITDHKLGNIANDLFRPQAKIAGGTAGAVRHEALTGTPVGGDTFHFGKAAEYVTALEKWLKKNGPAAGQHNVDAAKTILNDLQDALKAIH